MQMPLTKAEGCAISIAYNNVLCMEFCEYDHLSQPFRTDAFDAEMVEAALRSPPGTRPRLGQMNNNTKSYDITYRDPARPSNGNQRMTVQSDSAHNAARSWVSQESQPEAIQPAHQVPLTFPQHS